MNQVARRDRYTEEMNRIRAIVARHSLPSFLTGFDITLGEFGEDPALWVVFRTTDGPDLPEDEMMEHIRQRTAVRNAIRDDLFAEIDDRYPYFRYQSA